MAPRAIHLIEAEEAEHAARELCRVCYVALLTARSQSPGNADELAACRRELARAEAAHERVLAQLWRARTIYYTVGTWDDVLRGAENGRRGSELE